jgi:hypothetical protein
MRMSSSARCGRVRSTSEERLLAAARLPDDLDARRRVQHAPDTSQHQRVVVRDHNLRRPSGHFPDSLFRWWGICFRPLAP